MSRGGARWTEEQYADYQRRLRGAVQAPVIAPILPPPKERHTATPNRTEALYARLYLPGPTDGAVVRFQPFRLYLTNQHSYRPDWVVTWPDGRMECHEVKGEYIHSRDSRILFDTARMDWPQWTFVWARKRKSGEWQIERNEANHG